MANDRFEIKPTRFGKAVVKAAEHIESQKDMIHLYDVFLNTPFWLPVQRRKKNKKEKYFPIIMVHANGKRNLVVFEKKLRLEAWHGHAKGKVRGEVATALFDTGYQLLKKMPMSLLRKYDLYVDYGKRILLRFTPETTLWLRRVAIANKRKRRS